jgi:hypothetical protein
VGEDHILLTDHIEDRVPLGDCDKRISQDSIGRLLLRPLLCRVGVRQVGVSLQVEVERAQRSR